MTHKIMHTTDSSLNSLILRLFLLGIFFMPFTGMVGPGFLGELSRVASIWFLIPAFFACALLAKPAPKPTQAITRIALAWIVVLSCGFFFNLSDIIDNEFRGRTGLNKFVTSTMVIFYGLALSYLTAKLDYLEKGKLPQLIIKPTIYSLIFVAGVSVVEIAWWYIPSVEPIYRTISLILRPYSETLGFWSRLTVVAYEPSSLGLWLGFSMVVCMWAFMWDAAASARLHIVYGLFAVLSLTLLYFTQSRGGMTIALPILLFTLSSFLLGRKTWFLRLWMWGIFLGIFAILMFQMIGVDYIANHVVTGESLSNLSRYAMTVASFQMFYDNPLFGTGMGQFAFSAQNYMPAWGWYSIEVQSWLIDQSKGWPASFNLYARIMAETGFCGMLLWYVGTFVLFRYAMTFQLSQSNPSRAYFLVMLYMYFSLFGFAVETFNNVALWLALGFAAASCVSYSKPDEA